MNYIDTFGDDLLSQLKPDPNIEGFKRIEARIAKIENELEQMHVLLNRLCPGSNTKGGLTIAGKFEKLLTEGPEWAEVKKEENK